MSDFQKIGSVRIPPQNIEAEQSVLGSLILDSKAINIVVDILKADDFYDERHGIIYSAILDLYDKKEPIDALTLSSRLKEKKLLDKIGGSSYLTDLVNSVPTSSNAKHYADIVYKKSVLRDLIRSSEHISGLGYKEEEDVEILLDEAEKKIFSVARLGAKQRFQSVKDALHEAWERIDRLHNSDGEVRGVPTGFPEIDNILSGLQKADLVILAARPSMGKTTLALDIARKVALSDIPVGIFSLEMSAQQLVDRLLAAEAKIDSWKLRTGKLSRKSNDFDNLANAMDKLSRAPIFIDDETSSTVMQMRAKARRLQAEHGLGLVIVDYLQLMTPRTSTDNLVQQMTEISRALKGLARELNVPVLALSQLSRAVETRRPAIPKLHDLRDSGSIEQDADVVMFIYRESRYKPDTERGNITDIFVEKHRNGPTGRFELMFNPEKISFSSIEKRDFGEM
jgi:replicative DNA helicase